MKRIPLDGSGGVKRISAKPPIPLREIGVDELTAAIQSLVEL